MSRNKKIILICFCVGLICAVWAFFIGRSAVSPKESPEAVIQNFFTAVSKGNLNEARKFLIPGEEKVLRDPVSTLSQSTFANLKVETIGNTVHSGDGTIIVDVTLQRLNTKQIMNKAAFLMIDEMMLQSQTAVPEISEPDKVMNDIYEEILSQGDLPTESVLCLTTLKEIDHEWKIIPDDLFIRTIEGNLQENINSIRTLFEKTENESTPSP